MAAVFSAHSQVSNDELKQGQQDLKQAFHDLRHRLDVLEKSIDDILWHHRVGDVAYIDKVFMAGPPPRGSENATTLSETNPIKFWSYIFIPKDIDPSKKYPLLVFSHGGVHGDFNTYYTHIIRELMAQQYIIVAPEYRGSTGYGKRHFELIDYGGLENEDVHVLEVQNLINSLKAKNKRFEYEVFKDIPGGHSFDRMDHRMGRHIRFGIYKFLEKHLDPPRKFRNIQEMERAAYRF